MNYLSTIYRLFLHGIFGPSAEDGADAHGGDVVTVSPGAGNDGPVTPNEGHTPRYMWCIDAGHGEYSEGKRSPKLHQPVTILTRQPDFREWEFNRDVAERLIELLSAAGVAYMRTMPAHGKYGNALTERVNNANNHVTDLPKRGVSIHANAGPTSNPSGWSHNFRGVETWHYHGSVRGQIIASIFQTRIVRAVGKYTAERNLPYTQNRGLKSKATGQFYVLKRTNYPNVLTETLFFNNPDEVKYLCDPEFRQMVAEAHFDAIIQLETEPHPSALAETAPEDITAWLTIISFFASLFTTDPEERAANKRRRYVKSLQKKEAKGKITTEQYERYLADYDRKNTKP